MTSTNCHPTSGSPCLRDHLEDFGLPQKMAERVRQSSLKVDALTDSRRVTQKRRTYVKGLHISMIALAEDLLGRLGKTQMSDALTKYPPMKHDRLGRALNTLTLEVDGNLLSLRTSYNKVEATIRSTLRRPGYPNSAPYATGQWDVIRDDFDLIVSMTPGERALALDEMWNDVLALETLATRSGAPRATRPFEYLLQNVEKGAREPAGALLQALGFAYYRADSPNLTLVCAKVGKGSARNPVGVGDVDGWSGDSLALAVEVKDLSITNGNLHELAMFVARLRDWPNALAIVLANEFDEEAKEHLAENSILPLTTAVMLQNVKYWDFEKQRLAVREVLYFLRAIQQHPKMYDRLKEFIDGMPATEGDA